MILRQHFLAEQFNPHLSGPGRRADPLGWPKIVKNVFPFLDVSDQRNTFYVFLKNNILLSTWPSCFALRPGPGEYLTSEKSVHLQRVSMHKQLSTRNKTMQKYVFQGQKSLQNQIHSVCETMKS